MDFDLGSIADAVSGFFNDYGMQAGVTAQALGTIARRRALERVRREQEARVAEEAARQQALQQQADAALRGTVQTFTPQAQEAERQSIAGRYRTMMTPAALADGEYSTAAGTEGAPQDVRDRASRALAESVRKGQDYAKNLANLTSYGGLSQQQGIRLADTGRNLGEIARQSRASSSILPYELEGANRSARGAMTASDILNGLGDASFVYGASAPRKRLQLKSPSGGLSIPSYGTSVATGTI